MKLRALSFILLLFMAWTVQAQDDENTEESPLTTLLPKMEKWNDAINSGKLDILNELYADTIWVYGQKTTPAATITSKKNWLAKNVGYKQEIVDPFVRTTAFGYEIKFTKATTKGSVKKDYQAYLVFDHEMKEIIIESDETTDKNVAAKAKALPIESGRHCFQATGGIWPPIAEPTFYETRYDLHFHSGQVKGDGIYYSWAMRTMYTLEIKGKVNADNTVSLTVRSLGPLYPDDPKDFTEWQETRKWDGNQFILVTSESGGELFLESIDCAQ